jgi:hypothetical protein
MHTLEAWTPDIHCVANIACHQEVTEIAAFDLEFADIEHRNGPAFHMGYISWGRCPIKARPTAILPVTTMEVFTTLHLVASLEFLHWSLTLRTTPAMRCFILLIREQFMLPLQSFLDRLLLSKSCICSFGLSVIL